MSHCGTIFDSKRNFYSRDSDFTINVLMYEWLKNMWLKTAKSACRNVDVHGSWLVCQLKAEDEPSDCERAWPSGSCKLEDTVKLRAMYTNEKQKDEL